MSVEMWRQVLKKRARRAAATLRTAELLHTTATAAAKASDRGASELEEIMHLRKASAEVQHHDAVDGTSPGRVTSMWIRHLEAGERSAARALQTATEALLQKTAGSAGSASLSTEGEALGAALLAGKTAAVVVHNSLAWNRTEVLTLPLPASVRSVAVTDAVGRKLPSQLRKAALPADVWPNITADSAVEAELLVWATVPALGLETLFVTAGTTPEDADSSRTLEAAETGGDEIVAENGVLSLVFAKATGELRALHNSKAGLSANLTERAMVWSSKGSDNYKFEPAALPNSTGQSSVTVEAGAIATSVVKHSSSTTGVKVIQRWQLFHPAGPEGAAAAAQVDVSHAVLGPLPPNTEVSSRVFSTDSSGWASNGAFFTDESGWFVRERHFDPTKENDSLTNLAANMVPLYGSGFVRRADAQFTMMTAHSHGCGGGRESEALLEPFLARNPPGDDNSTVTSHFRWSLDSPESAEPSRVASTLALQHPLRPMYGSASSRTAWLAQHSAGLAPLGAMALPPDVHLLSLNEWNASFVLLRLQHLREVSSPGGRGGAGQPATVDVSALLKGVGRLGRWEERSLNAIHPRAAKERERLAWTTAQRDAVGAEPGYTSRGDGREAGGGLTVTLQPLEIRTWLVELL